MSTVRYTVVVAKREQRRKGVLAEFIADLERSSDLVLRESSDAFIVHCTSSTEIILGERGDQLIIGTLFDGDRRVSEMPPTSTVIWDADQLTAGFWGGFVAITTRANGVEVLRDPSGAVSCYHFRHAGAHIFTSEPSLTLRVASIRPSIDWTTVSQALVYRDLRPTRTALTSVEELLPGTARSWRGDLQVGGGMAPDTAAEFLLASSSAAAPLADAGAREQVRVRDRLAAVCAANLRDGTVWMPARVEIITATA